MSLTVVGATLLAAIACKQLRAEVEALSTSALSSKKKLAAAEKILKSSCIERKRRVVSFERQSSEMVDGVGFIRELAAVADEAVATSIWCTVSS